MRPSSICLSRYLLLNHWAEFNQICYITSPHGTGMREQHYFSVSSSLRPCVCRLSICPSYYLLLNQWAEFNQSWYFTSSHGMGVREQRYFPCGHPSMCPSSAHLLVTLSPTKTTGWNSAIATSLSLMVRMC